MFPAVHAVMWTTEGRTAAGGREQHGTGYRTVLYLVAVMQSGSRGTVASAIAKRCRGGRATAQRTPRSAVEGTVQHKYGTHPRRNNTKQYTVQYNTVVRIIRKGILRHFDLHQLCSPSRIGCLMDWITVLWSKCDTMTEAGGKRRSSVGETRLGGTSGTPLESYHRRFPKSTCPSAMQQQRALSPLTKGSISAASTTVGTQGKQNT